MRVSKSSFSPEESKSKILRGYCGGQLIPEVLFTWKWLSLWPKTQSEDKNISEDGQLRKR